MAWDIEMLDGCAVVGMNTHKINVQNDRFFADLHGAFDRLEREFSELPVVLTGQGDVFSAGIDFQYSFEIFGSGSLDTIQVRAQRGAHRHPVQILIEELGIPYRLIPIDTTRGAQHETLALSARVREDPPRR